MSLSGICFYCRESIRKENPVDSAGHPKPYVTAGTDEVYMCLLKDEKAGHIYFHIECFETVAGKDMCAQLEAELK